MKTLLLLLVTAGLLTSGVSRGQTNSAVTLDFFYESLDPYGHWMEVSDYGYCWQPRNVGPNWSPYSEGRWLYSDVGWIWVSDEPYGWAVYHYGRWANLASVGWIWVPDTEWGPGWVSWRQNDQYVGWAPLPPEARFRSSVGFSSWVDRYYGIGPGHYRFVEARNFGSPRLQTVFIDQSQNLTIINRTTNITNIRYENNTVFNEGPRYDMLSRMTAEPIRKYRIQRRQDLTRESNNKPDDFFLAREEQETLSVFAPPIDERRPASGPTRNVRKIDDARIDRGWELAGSPDEIAALRDKMKGTVEAPKDLPPEPTFSRGMDRPGTTGSLPKADRPPTPRESAPTAGPGRAAPTVQDAPPSRTPGPTMERDRPQTRPPGNLRPTERQVPMPEVKTPETRRPDTQRPDMKKPEARKPEAPKSETRRPDAQRPDMKKPEARKPEAPKSETRRPDAQRPDMKKPEARKPEAPKSETRRPDTLRPESQKPETRQEPPKREQPQAKAPQQRKPEASRPAPPSQPPTPSNPQRGKGDKDKPDRKKSDAKAK